LLTLKRVPYLVVLHELFFFISGDTRLQTLHEHNVHIWDGNSSPEYMERRGLAHYPPGVLGPIYGFQWRHFGAEYDPLHPEPEYYVGKGYDQLKTIIETIKHDPTSRQHLFLSAWNPPFHAQMVLPPCHVSYQFYVDMKHSKIHCTMHMRSSDVFLGLPFNLASTAFLTVLIAHCASIDHQDDVEGVIYSAGDVTITFGDVHIYEDHEAQAKEVIARAQTNSKEVTTGPSVYVRPGAPRDIDLLRWTDVVVEGYTPLPTLKAPMNA
jgi:thymidylate synthase